MALARIVLGDGPEAAVLLFPLLLVLLPTLAAWSLLHFLRPANRDAASYFFTWLLSAGSMSLTLRPGRPLSGGSMVVLALLGAAVGAFLCWCWARSRSA
jgi:hypothetical protein